MKIKIKADIPASYKQSGHAYLPKPKKRTSRIGILSNFVFFHRKCAKFVKKPSMRVPL
jgi:hypothetical protein